MRAYFFTNFYLSQIQHGIQSCHVMHEMFRKYNDDRTLFNKEHQQLLHDWADNHKTIIVKNGGDTETMHNIKELCEKMYLPWAYFNEPSLDNALTCIGVIVPEEYYDKNISNRLCKSWCRSPIQNDFVYLVQNSRLA